jgi:hypothetical protein
MVAKKTLIKLPYLDAKRRRFFKVRGGKPYVKKMNMYGEIVKSYGNKAVNLAGGRKIRNPMTVKHASIRPKKQTLINNMS